MPPRPRAAGGLERNDGHADRARLVELRLDPFERHLRAPAAVAEGVPRRPTVFVDPQPFTLVRSDEAVPLGRVEPDHRAFQRSSLHRLACGGREAPAALAELDRDDALCLGTLRPFDRVELHLRALRERLEAFAGDRRVVDENVLATVSRGDEAVPLRVVEPLDGSSCHENTSSARTRTGRGSTQCANRYSLEYPGTVARHPAAGLLRRAATAAQVGPSQGIR